MKTQRRRSKGRSQVAMRKTVRREATRIGPGEPRRLPAAIKNILVPVDFSPGSRGALAYAVPFAEQFDAKLILLHVVEPVATPDFLKSFPLAMENDKIMAAAERRLKTLLKEEEVDPRMVGKSLVRYGRSFHEIADAARTLRADLIIIATHGYTGFKHALLGSTTERVVRHAACPVLVVRTGK